MAIDQDLFFSSSPTPCFQKRQVDPDTTRHSLTTPNCGKKRTPCSVLFRSTAARSHEEKVAATFQEAAQQMRNPNINPSFASPNNIQPRMPLSQLRTKPFGGADRVVTQKSGKLSTAANLSIASDDITYPELNMKETPSSSPTVPSLSSDENANHTMPTNPSLAQTSPRKAREIDFWLDSVTLQHRNSMSLQGEGHRRTALPLCVSHIASSSPKLISALTNMPSERLTAKPRTSSNKENRPPQIPYHPQPSLLSLQRKSLLPPSPNHHRDRISMSLFHQSPPSKPRPLDQSNHFEPPGPTSRKESPPLRDDDDNTTGTGTVAEVHDLAPEVELYRKGRGPRRRDRCASYWDQDLFQQSSQPDKATAAKGGGREC